MQWKPTRDNLVKMEKSIIIIGYERRIRTAGREALQDLDADYVVKFDMDAAKAQPTRRKVYDNTTLASNFSIPQPYVDKKDPSGMSVGGEDDCSVMHLQMTKEI